MVVSGGAIQGDEVEKEAGEPSPSCPDDIHERRDLREEPEEAGATHSVATFAGTVADSGPSEEHTSRILFDDAEAVPRPPGLQQQETLAVLRMSLAGGQETPFGELRLEAILVVQQTKPLWKSTRISFDGGPRSPSRGGRF